MIMKPRLSKFVLTAHISFSVGWLGAVAGFLALSIAGLSSEDALRVRAAYLAMELIGWYVIVPLSFASLLTGLVQALCTPWGLFRHHWVLAKLLINVLATVLLFVHMRPIVHLADAASEMMLSSADLRGPRIQIAADAGAALLALVVATTLSVYKPQGRTRYGRKKYEQSVGSGRESTTGTPRWVYVSGIIAVVLLVIVRHLTLGGHGH